MTLGRHPLIWHWCQLCQETHNSTSRLCSLHPWNYTKLSNFRFARICQIKRFKNLKWHYIWMVCWLFVCNTGLALMLLWPLEMSKSSYLSLGRKHIWDIFGTYPGFNWDMLRKHLGDIWNFFLEYILNWTHSKFLNLALFALNITVFFQTLYSICSKFNCICPSSLYMCNA